VGEAPKGEPDATPRQGYSGSAQRQRPVFRERHGDDWLVEVVPITGMTTGRPLNGGGELPRAVFEVRAECWGPTRPEFDFRREAKAKRIAEHYIADQELAVRTARKAVEQLRAGERDIFLPQIEEEVK
jgi:hypothetical protein